MAGLEQLKKRLRSVELSGQLAGAMRTVASAKYARINRMYAGYRHYAEEMARLARLCGDSVIWHSGAAAVPDCYVVLGHNRGMCGGYNAQLHAFMEEVLTKAARAGSDPADTAGEAGQAPAPLVVLCGKATIAYCQERGIRYERSFLLPDVPDFDACRPLLALLESLYREGKVRSVHLIHQHFVNTLSQIPADKLLLPLEGSGEGGQADILWIPDRETVCADIGRRILDTVFFQTVLEAALGAQAATLTAMRTAYDNATESAEKLTIQMNKRRQSAVTTGVIETSSGALHEGEE